MKRLVYSPKVNAYIKADSGIYDISEYITEFSVDRKINQVSSAELTIRNPKKKWTSYTYQDPISKEQVIGPVFHPMDPITILLTRLQNRPVQVFTGFCDSTPYLQLFPGTVTIKASCTLKKLQYTFFDAGLPFMREFLTQWGWMPNYETGQIVNPTAENRAAKRPGEEVKVGEEEQSVRFGDSGIGELLFHVLHEIGGWPDSTIFIQEMPESIITLVSNLFELFRSDSEESQRELEALLRNIIGTTSLGGGGEPVGIGSGSSPPSGSAVSPIDAGRAMITVSASTPTAHQIAQGLTTMSHESSFGTTPGWDEEHTGGVLGYWQIQQSTHPQYSSACCMNLLCSTKAAYEISNHWTNWGPWAMSDFGSETIPESAITPWISQAEKALKLGGFAASSTKQGTVHR